MKSTGSYILFIEQRELPKMYITNKHSITDIIQNGYYNYEFKK